MATLFRTGNGTSTDTIICALELVSPDWFRRALVGALELMCREENWTKVGDADIDFARDKANEMLESLEIDVIIPTLPIGSIVMWASDTIPEKWIEMGQAVSKTTYPELFDIFGYTFGGAFDMFVIPTMAGYSPYGAGADVDLNDTGGADTTTLSIGNLPAHSHSVNDPGHVHIIEHTNNVVGGSTVRFASNTTGQVNPNGSSLSATTGITIGNTGSGNPISRLHAVRGLNFIIYAGR